METIFQESWAQWGIALIVGYPFLTLIMNELTARLRSKDSPLAPIAAGVSTLLLPVAAIAVLMTKVAGLDPTSAWVRLIMTAWWIAIINIGILILNAAVFNEQATGWRARVPRLMQDIVRVFIVMIGAAFVASQIWGADLGRFFAALGVGSIVLGLALQDTLGGVFSGIMLISGRQIQEGDWISVEDVVGQVVSTNWRAFSVRTRNDTLVILPNQTMAKAKITNFTRPYPRHREVMNFSLDIRKPPHEVRAALIKTAAEIPEILTDPAPVASAVKFSAPFAEYEVRFFISDYKQVPMVRDKFMAHFWYVAQREGIEFPLGAEYAVHIEGGNLPVAPTVEEHVRRFCAVSALGLEVESFAAEIAALPPSATRYLRFGNGEIVSAKGGREEFLNLILAGALREVSEGGGTPGDAGTLRQGQFFGLSPADGASFARADLIADGEVELLRIDAAAAWRLFNAHPDLARAASDLSVMRTRRWQHQMRVVSDTDPSEKRA